MVDPLPATLVDTNVLLDVLLEGAAHGDESEARLAAALQMGPLWINDIIAAELAPVFDDEGALWSMLRARRSGWSPIRAPAFTRPAGHSGTTVAGEEYDTGFFPTS